MQITQSIAIPERYTMLAAEKKNEERGGSIKINRKRRRREKKNEEKKDGKEQAKNCDVKNEGIRLPGNREKNNLAGENRK